VQTLKCFMKFKTYQAGEQWEYKLAQRGDQQKLNMMDTSSDKKSKLLSLSQSNFTVPWISFLKHKIRPHSIFEIELVNEKGCYYRIAFTNSNDDEEGRVKVSNEIPD